MNKQQPPMSGPLIVPYNSKYKLAFKTLNLTWISHYFTVESKDLEQLENPEQLIASGGQIYYALVGREVAGCCAILKQNANEYEIAKMAVDAQFQGLGLAHELMEAVENYAWQAGAQRIFILSNTKLEPAIRLYKKHGYMTLNNDPHPDYRRCNIEMEKKRPVLMEIT